MANFCLLDMQNDALAARLGAIIQSDPLRMRCLAAVRDQALPDWFIAAGFVRNAIWDYQHGYTHSTPLNDIDVVYFNKQATKQVDLDVQDVLSKRVPEVNWEVKNQARMHQKHGHVAYQSSAEAIAHWIENVTCVGARLSENDVLQVIAPYGLDSGFSLRVSINPDFPNEAVYRQRIRAKQWELRWPQLCIELPSQRASESPSG